MCLCLCAAPVPALAQSSKENAQAAQKLFDEALALMKAGKYAEACPRLQQSQKLDPGMGTKYRLAECYESAGLAGSAWQLFTEVAADAKAAGRTDREAQSRQKVSALQAKVPWMTLTIPAATAGLAGLEVKRDGEPVAAADFNRKVPVDPGAHTITVTATGKKPFQQSVRALEGGTVEVTVPALENEASAAPAPVPVTPTPEPASSGLGGQRIGAIVAGAVGVAGIVVGSAFGAMAKSKWDGALAGCENGDKTRCSSTAIDGGRSATTMAHVSTIGFVTGGAGLATGLILWLTAPSKKAPATGLRFVPVVGPDGVSGFVQGRF
ncbi:hypothetical protein A7982_12069 [Minicystis rosea]|nr:hypothetical protein A7982_12069 [Minicystis rosea]